MKQHITSITTNPSSSKMRGRRPSFTTSALLILSTILSNHASVASSRTFVSSGTNNIAFRKNNNHNTNRRRRRSASAKSNKHSNSASNQSNNRASIKNRNHDKTYLPDSHDDYDLSSSSPSSPLSPSSASPTHRQNQRQFEYFENELDNSNYNDHVDYQSYHQDDSENITTNTNNSQLLQVPLSLILQHHHQDNQKQPKHEVSVKPMNILLDTGAQVTIITYETAKRIGIAHLIDTRYAGHASGVAGVSCRVLGRIPARTVSFVLCNEHGNCYDNDDDELILDNTPAITVLEDNIMDGGVDMLIGLDLLEEWKATLCLSQRTLTVRGAIMHGGGGPIESLVIPLAKLKDNGKSRRSTISTKTGTATGTGTATTRKTDSFFSQHESTTQILSSSSSSSAPSPSSFGRRISSRIPSSIDEESSHSTIRSDAPSVHSFVRTEYDLDHNTGDTNESIRYNSDDNDNDDDALGQSSSVSQEEFDEYCDENYYFVDSESEFDECDLSGL